MSCAPQWARWPIMSHLFPVAGKAHNAWISGLVYLFLQCPGDCVIISRRTPETERPFMGMIWKFYWSLVEGRQNSTEEQKCLLLWGIIRNRCQNIPIFYQKSFKWCYCCTSSIISDSWLTPDFSFLLFKVMLCKSLMTSVQDSRSGADNSLFVP